MIAGFYFRYHTQHNTTQRNNVLFNNCMSRFKANESETKETPNMLMTMLLNLLNVSLNIRGKHARQNSMTCYHIMLDTT